MRGRPRTGRTKFIMSFAISKDMGDLLRCEPNRSWTIDKALRDFYGKRKL